jgi:hypothetical protein
MPGRKLYFEGLRWPYAVATETVLVALTLDDGTPLPPRPFVELVAPGLAKGAHWRPTATDACWRDLAELNLSSHQDCQRFARRRGDLADGLKQGRLLTPHKVERGKVVTSQWFPLAEALRQAALAWGPVDEFGVSHFLAAKRDEANAFLAHPAAATALDDQVKYIADPDRGGLADKAKGLAGFLAFSAAQAIERGLTMTKCKWCGFWFEIRRPARTPEYCSPACRTMRHQSRNPPD